MSANRLYLSDVRQIESLLHTHNTDHLHLRLRRIAMEEQYEALYTHEASSQPMLDEMRRQIDLVKKLESLAQAG